NGGNGGIGARPTAAEEAAEREQHIRLTNEQAQHEIAASANREQLASVNRGRPAIMAVERPVYHPPAGARPEAPREAPAPRPEPQRPEPQRTEQRPPAEHAALHPAPQTHPAPQQHPAPANHPAPPHPQAHPHPQGREEKKRDEH
ncbi:MAG TPA: hypothetical protein VNX47_06990, partial [Nevskia sp.]|nr:hypothetical protein [Nevskia sp.]